VADEFLIPKDGDLYRDFPAHSVWTKQHWADDWTYQTHLYCNSVRWGAGPVRPEAILQWEYGELMPAGTAEFAKFVRRELLGCYVKVPIEQGDGEDPLLWYGIITGDGRQQGGAMTFGEGDEAEKIKTGTQLLRAEGLDLLLLRTFLATSWVSTGGGGDRRIERGLTFNAPNQFSDQGNRTSGRGPQDSYLFASDLESACCWSTRDILEYLLAYLLPRDPLGLRVIRMKLSAGAKDVLPTWDRPVIKTQGRTLRSVINELCARERLLSWSLNVANEEPDALVELDVHSFLSEALTLPSGNTQQANPNLVELGLDKLDIEAAVDAQPVLHDSEHQRVEQVIVRGARKRAVCSFAHADGTLEADWLPADETDYETLPEAIAALSNLSERQGRMAAYRSEDRRARVFAWFRVPVDWDRYVGDGTGGDKIACAPVDEATGKLPELYLPELRFERGLLKEMLANQPERSPRTGLGPIALIKIETGEGDNPDLYAHVEQLTAYSGIEGKGQGAGQDFNCSLRVQPDAPGVIVKTGIAVAAEGTGQHDIAATDFTPISEINDRTPVLDWQTMIITAMFELDEYVEQRWPASKQIPADRDVARLVYVDLGDRARLDWLHPGAVIGVLDGQLQYLTALGYPADGTYVRDDCDAMKDLARFVYEWYGRARQAFTLNLQQLSGIVHVGDLITTIGSDETGPPEEVNALVTGVFCDLLAGTTTVTTAYAELDPVQLF